MKNNYKIALCFVMACLLSVQFFPIDVLCAEELKTIDSMYPTNPNPFTMTISESIPTGEGVAQPNSVEMIMPNMLDIMAINNTSTGLPGSLNSSHTIYTTDISSVQAYKFYDRTDQDNRNLQNEIETVYGYTELVDDNIIDFPTWRYNCHSYAWYNNNWYNNEYWINNNQVPIFIDDLHTVEVTESSLRAGDIVTYWYVEHENGEIVSYEQCVHSALVYDIEFDGTIVCKSKWGNWGLYIHDIDYVPEDYCNDVYDLSDGTYQGKELVCLFYRYTQDEHNYSVGYNTTHHYSECTQCEDLVITPHTYLYTDYSINYHTISCLNCNYSAMEEHNWIAVIGGYTCTDCSRTSTTIPGIMSLNDTELAAFLADLTDEELAELTLALNEDDRGRIAALLPEREDDLVTE